jgi:hypothetical protein
MTLVGLRLGATLAFTCAAASERAIDALVLWDPIVDGHAYVAELMALERELGGSASNRDRLAAVDGFPFSDRLREELERINLLSLDPPKAGRVLLVDTSGESAPVVALHERLQQTGIAVERRFIPAAPVWHHQANQAAVPGRVIQEIASWLAGAR